MSKTILKRMQWKMQCCTFMAYKQNTMWGVWCWQYHAVAKFSRAEDFIDGAKCSMYFFLECHAFWEENLLKTFKRVEVGLWEVQQPLKTESALTKEFKSRHYAVSESEDTFLTLKGIQFQSFEAAKANAWSPLSLCLVLGSQRSCWSVNLKEASGCSS